MKYIIQNRIWSFTPYLVSILTFVYGAEEYRLIVSILLFLHLNALISAVLVHSMSEKTIKIGSIAIPKQIMIPVYLLNLFSTIYLSYLVLILSGDSVGEPQLSILISLYVVTTFIFQIKIKSDLEEKSIEIRENPLSLPLIQILLVWSWNMIVDVMKR